MLDTFLGIVKKNENSHPEIWNGPNNGGFFVQMGAYNSFARIAMDQAIEPTANKDINHQCDKQL